MMGTGKISGLQSYEIAEREREREEEEEERRG
jgi:hypothetical protein